MRKGGPNVPLFCIFLIVFQIEQLWALVVGIAYYGHQYGKFLSHDINWPTPRV